MPFSFKQFAIAQSNSAMKVGVDAVILGAWADIAMSSTVLDVGAGTGILSLMLAQRNKSVNIYSIEIDKGAFVDLQNNVCQSPWHDRIHTINDDFLTHKFPLKYDCIISNPPFFKASKSNIQQNRKTARIADVLSPNVLCQKVNDIINVNGRFIVIYPFDLRLRFIKAAFANGFCLYKQLIVSDKKDQKPVRCILCFTTSRVDKVVQEFIFIKNDDGSYTEDYKLLTEDYYLG